MGNSKDNDSDTRRRPKAEERPGAVEHDKRGNAVWKWAVDSGRDMLDSTSKLLKRLEVPGLSLDGADPEGEGLSVDRHAGYDPYGTNRPKSPPVTKKPSAPVAPAAATKSTAPASADARPSVLARLLRKP